MSLFSAFLQGSRPLLVVSFPKSGRTWLRVVLDDLGVADQKSLRDIAQIDPTNLATNGSWRDTAVSDISGASHVRKIALLRYEDVRRDTNDACAARLLEMAR